ncbi:hypothetical protein PRZ48_010668 [Zasmidium cellare]|uniref:Dienelactone hydrolase domain-containing protein n=1 Tax=Zasmidium cellare TaxID=395010 RepID=A0ABR0E9C6_ZASCE|nr:hypothetical protein PRZ48_010668 [Zasmidium cellare]
MTSTHSSAACCTTPVPKATASYTPKGTYHTIANIKTYITGPSTATKAIFHIYDIFGYRTPTLQGADILASAGYLVIMPDFFEGSPAEPEWMGGSEEGKAKFGAFLGGLKDAGPFLEKIETILPALKKEYSGVEKWASIGFCWGGKIVAVTSAGTETPWSVGIQTSPAQVDPEDARKISIPSMMLASEGEDEGLVKAWGEAFGGKERVVERWGREVHGWMSARSNLEDAERRAEFERGYGVVLGFLERHF